MPKIVLFFLLLHFFSINTNAQVISGIKIVDSYTKLPIPGATISINNKSVAISNKNGIFNLDAVVENQTITISAVGYQNVKSKINFSDSNIKEILLIPEEQSLEEVTIISSTRTNQPIESAPIKVEVLEYEEMQEESTVKPSTVLGIIGDASGVQIQQSSAVSGNANVRIQGLDGKYTQILRDGLPLYEGFSGGFGVMSIPPLDLKQIELIKGSASTLYGGGAIGGLINLISKKPSVEREGIITLNQTTLKETNFNSFFSKKHKKIGYTFYAGGTKQLAVDVNKDGFSDVSKNSNIMLHPRLFFYPNHSTNIIIGYTSTLGNRLGGDMQVINNHKDSLHQYFQKNDLLRNSAEFLLEKNVDDRNKFVIKSSWSSFERAIKTASHFFNANQSDYYSEVTWLVNQKHYSWITGFNVTGNQFKKLPSDFVNIQNTNNNTVGAFTQYTYTLKENTTIEAGLRNDYNNKYHNFLLPRIAIFHKINNHFGCRGGVGVGYKIPDALSPQMQDYDIENIVPINENIVAENSVGYNAEVNYKLKWGEGNSLFVNQAFFLTQIMHPIIATEGMDNLVRFSNELKPIVTKGFDTYLKLKLEEWELYAGYTYTIAERKYLAINQFIPFTPTFRMAYMLTKEIEGKARFCMEASYNGFQYREDYTKTPGYLFMAAMAELHVSKHLSVVINCENILDYRQSKKESLYTGTMTNPVFNTLWAPIDGRAINLCLKFKL